MKFNKLKRGERIFKCESCGRNCRDVGQSSDSYCIDCYELAGISNAIADNGPEALNEYKSAIEAHCANIIAKGGTLDSDNEHLLKMARK